MIYKYLFGTPPISVIYYFLIHDSKAIGVEYKLTKDREEKIGNIPSSLVDNLKTVRPEKLKLINLSSIDSKVLRHAIRVALTLNQSEIEALK